MKVRNSSENLIPRPTFAFEHESTAVGRNDLGLILNPRCPPGAPPVPRAVRPCGEPSMLVGGIGFCFFSTKFFDVGFFVQHLRKGALPMARQIRRDIVEPNKVAATPRFRQILGTVARIHLRMRSVG